MKYIIPMAKTDNRSIIREGHTNGMFTNFTPTYEGTQIQPYHKPYACKNREFKLFEEYFLPNRFEVIFIWTWKICVQKNREQIKWRVSFIHFSKIIQDYVGLDWNLKTKNVVYTHECIS